jgi:hypothetical protein
MCIWFELVGKKRSSGSWSGNNQRVKAMRRALVVTSMEAPCSNFFTQSDSYVKSANTLVLSLVS